MSDEGGDAISASALEVSTLTFVVQASDSETVRAAVRRVHHLFPGREADIDVDDEPDPE
jgi:hypothetical protein